MPELVRLYNTLSRQLEDFQPLDQGRVRLYCCGPTVYNFQHIGNLRTYVFEDVLVRVLRFAGYDVEHVMNITDVGHLVSDADDGEDKMLVAAKREKKSSSEIAEYYTQIFLEHCDWLNIKRPSTICKATEHVEEMIEMIKRIEENGAAYVAGGNVYFDVSKDENYGELAKLDLESLQAGARIEVDQEKKNPLDFALWFTRSKFANEDYQQELLWDSPWGKGYPGWHIECSAMSTKYLGEEFDIHCGGIDHIPVHHTNEIAQCRGASGKCPAKVWMHGGFLLTNKEKMSKSTGEFLTLDVLRDKGYDPIAYRLFCFSASYRGELMFSFDALQSAQNTLKKLKKAVFSWRKDRGDDAHSSRYDEHLSEFKTAVFNDLSMPNALRVLHAVIGDEALSNTEKLDLVSVFDQVLGLGIDDWEEEQVAIPAEVHKLVEERQAARASRDWAKADELRDKILALGFVVEDSADGAQVKPKE